MTISAPWMGVYFDGWLTTALARIAPGGKQVVVELTSELQQTDVSTRILPDGAVDLPVLARPTVRADVVVGFDEPRRLSAGNLADGRALTLELRVRATKDRE